LFISLIFENNLAPSPSLFVNSLKKMDSLVLASSIAFLPFLNIEFFLEVTVSFLNSAFNL